MSHQIVSFIKSAIRIVGYVLLVPTSYGALALPALILVFSEIIGIIEEIGH